MSKVFACRSCALALFICFPFALRGAERSFPGDVPLAFEPNFGQAAGDVRYIAHARNYDVLLTTSGAVLASGEGAVDILFEGARPNPRATASAELPGKVNYFTGSDPSRWRSGLPTYAQVRYEGLWPGIDAVFYGRGGRLEFDFVLEPGAEPRDIALTIEGRGRLSPEGGGDLLFEGAGGTFRLVRPAVY